MAVEGAVSSARVPIWYDEKARSAFYQAITAIALILFVWYLANNTIDNLETQGISTGFAFLAHPTGFGISSTLINYSEESTYLTAFYVGVLNTLFVSFVGMILATIIGFIVGVLRLSSNWLVAKLATVYIEVFRNIPLLLQILFWYFAVLGSLPRIRDSIEFGGVFLLNNRGLYSPRMIFEDIALVSVVMLVVGIIASIIIAKWARKRQDETGQQFPVFTASMGLVVALPILSFVIVGTPVTLEHPELKGFNFQGGWVIVPEFMALLFALSIYTGAFIAEIVRAGIQAVSHGQTEAAHAVGLRNAPTLRLVIIPQAMRVIIPPLTSQYLNLTKNSSLAAAIGYPELVAVFAGTVLNQTGQAVECIAMTMLVYFSISMVISLFMNWYNKRVALVER
jgi:general L-amino acid transport system permease protein